MQSGPGAGGPPGDGGGPEGADERSRVSVVGWLVVALVCLLAGVLAVSNTPEPAQPAGVLSPEEANSWSPAQPIATPDLVVGLGENLALGYTCPSLALGTKISVSFELVNWSGTDISVLGIEARPVATGPRVSGTTTSGGTCTDPGAAPAAGLITPGQSRLFTITFARPSTCPAQLTVGATSGSWVRPGTLWMQVQQLAGVSTKLTKELGTLYFDRCPPLGT